MNSQEYRVFFTERQGDAAEIARVLTAEKDEAKVIVIVGGEGTYNEVLNGVSFKGLLTFGYVPAGFRNALSKGFQSFWKVDRQARQILHPKICRTMRDRSGRSDVPQSALLSSEKPDDKTSHDENTEICARIKTAFPCKTHKRIYFA